MSTYHADHFEPTVDEIETLKRLELGHAIAVNEALKDHVSARLLEWGLVAKDAQGALQISPSGRSLVRRQNN